jgi:hypothetical protein
MATYNEQLQKLWHQFNVEHGGAPEAPRVIVEWALERGLLALPKMDPVQVLAGDMSRALREEYDTDASGRRYRVNHAVRISKNGVQLALWAELTKAPRAYMQKAFAQRRKQIVGDCVQLKVDVDVYNDNHRDQAALQMVFDFTDDVAEAVVMMPANDTDDTEAA